MIDYQKMYLTLFNAVSDSILLLEQLNFGDAKKQLIQAQLACEEIYVSSEED